MIAPKLVPEKFRKWNIEHGAPFGKHLLLKQFMPRGLYQKLGGPFALQPNNTTREFEYPWAFYAAPINAGLRALEIGGGLSGFQFVLDGCGCRVVNVDPGLEAKGKGWSCDPSAMAKLNRLFGTAVELRNTTIGNADLEPQSFDRVFSISVVEHLLDEEIKEAMSIAFSCLKSGGYFIATIDLYLNAAPLTSRRANEYGKNIDVKNMIEQAPFELVQGNRNELYGYPEFDPDRVQSNLENYFIGAYPALTQCIVLQRPR